jgi:hypothetical protein
MPLVPPQSCSIYWDASDWLPLTELLERWCHGDQDCWKAKWYALISACERGEVEYRRTDGKDYDDPPTELARRNVLLIGRQSFESWVGRVEGLDSDGAPTAAAQPPAPSWFDIPAVPTLSANSPKLQPSAPAPARSPAHAVPSERIIEAFSVMADEAENLVWWKTRMRNAKDYQLDGARISAGRLKQSSMWDPGLVAVWLHEKKYLKLGMLKRILDREFPDRADVLDYLASE